MTCYSCVNCYFLDRGGDLVLCCEVLGRMDGPKEKTECQYFLREMGSDESERPPKVESE